MKSTCKVTIAVIFLVIASIANALQPTIVATGLASPLVMAVNGEFLYFTTTGETLYRIPKTSSNITPALLPPPIAIAVGISGGLNDIAFDASNIFIHAGGYNNGYIVRRAKDLSGINTSLVNAGTMVGVNGTDMYFTNVNVPISKINVLETNPANSQIVSLNSYFLRQKTLDATSFYFTNLVNPTQIVRFDVGTKTETPLTSVPSEGNLFIDDANIYISPGYVGFGVLKISKQGGPLQTLVPGTNGAIGYTVGGGYVYYVENSTLWAIPSGGGAPVNLASPVDVHNMVYDNGTLYWAPSVGTTIYSLAVATLSSGWLWPIQGTDDRSLLRQGFSEYQSIPSIRNPSGRSNHHTGFDIHTDHVGVPVVATADGAVVHLQKNRIADMVKGSPTKCNNSTFANESGDCGDHGDGNTIVIKHLVAGGPPIYSQYQHLLDDKELSGRPLAIDPALWSRIVEKCGGGVWTAGVIECSDGDPPMVQAGQVIAFSGSSGTYASDPAPSNKNYLPHLHFELKTFPSFASLNAVEKKFEYGYTRDVPTFRGYIDPISRLDKTIDLAQRLIVEPESVTHQQPNCGKSLM